MLSWLLLGGCALEDGKRHVLKTQKAATERPLGIISGRTFTLEDFLEPSRKACGEKQSKENKLGPKNMPCVLLGTCIDLLGACRGCWRLFVATLFAFLVSRLIAQAPSRQSDGGRRVLECGVEL